VFASQRMMTCVPLSAAILCHRFIIALHSVQTCAGERVSALGHLIKPRFGIVHASESRHMPRDIDRDRRQCSNSPGCRMKQVDKRALDIEGPARATLTKPYDHKDSGMFKYHRPRPIAPAPHHAQRSCMLHQLSASSGGWQSH
jgi:hypothetical protein